MSTLVAQTISNGSVSTSSANVIQGSAKAWVNFNGSNGTRRASYNVSSITRNGSGDYTVNFANAMPDADYVVAMQGPGSLNGTTWELIPGFLNASGTTTPVTKTTNAFRYVTFNPYSPNAGNYDASQCGVAIFR